MLMREMEAGHKLIVWISPTGAGKTAGACIYFVTKALERHLQGLFTNLMFCGPSIGQFMENTEEIFMDICEQYEIPFDSSAGARAHYSFGDFARARIVGGDNIRSAKRAMGASTLFNWIDEAPHVHPDTIDAVITRNRTDDAVTLLTGNAESPYNAVNQKYIEADLPYTKFFEVDFYDNQHIGDKQREFLESGALSDHAYKRLIKNQWVPAEGLVYPITADMIKKREFEPWGVVAFDLGIEGTTAALLFVQYTDGTYHIADEYYHNGRKQGVLTDDEHLGRITSKWDVDYFIVDPSAASFRATARRSGYVVRNADNDIESGIQAVLQGLHRKQLTIEPTCVNLLTEASAYHYNEQTDKPVKKNDHACDAMRYGARFLLPHIRTMLYAT